MAFPQNSFDQQDALLTVTRALPAQNTSVTSASIDMGNAQPTLAGTHSDVVLDIQPTTTATGQNFSFTIQDSADNVSFANLGPLASRGITGVANATFQTQYRWRLPDTVRRYIRLSIAASATTGDQTGSSATLSVRT